MKRVTRGRVIRMRAEQDGRIVKITASILQAKYHSRADQTRYHNGLADELHHALRNQGFHSPQIRFEE